MVRFGSGTIELERIRPRRIPLHFFRHELELHTETSGVKSGSARSPEGGGEAMERGKRQLGLSLARHPPRLVARVNRSISILFYHQNCTASFSNPPPLSSLSPKSRLNFSSNSLSNGFFSIENWNDKERREERKTHDPTRDYSLRPTFSSSRTRIDTRIQHGIDIVPSRGHSFPTKATPTVLAFTYRKREPWKTGA